MGLRGAWATAGVGRPGARVISSAAKAISCQIGRITDISLHVRQAIRFEGLTGQRADAQHRRAQCDDVHVAAIG